MPRRPKKQRAAERSQCSSSVSPVEAAVLCKNEAWLNEALLNWKLSGNVITEEGHHVLGRALRTCSYEMVRMLFDCGELRRKVGRTSFDMDGVLVESFFRVCKDESWAKNSPAHSRKLVSSLADYRDYLKGSKDSHDHLGERSYNLQAFRHVASQDSLEEMKSERVLTLEKALRLYIDLVRKRKKEEEGKDEHESRECTYLAMPLQNSKSLLSISNGIPECANLSLLIIKEMRQKDIEPIICATMQKGNDRLLALMLDHFKEAQKIISALPSHKIALIGRTLAAYTSCPEKILGHLKEAPELKVLSESRRELLRKPSGKYEDRFDGNVLAANRAAMLNVMYEIMLSTPELAKEGIKTFYTEPVFWHKLLTEKLPQLFDGIEDKETLEDLSNSLLSSVSDLIKRGHVTLLIDLLPHVQSVQRKYLASVVRSHAPDFSLASDRFLFLYVHFKEYLSGELPEDSCIYRVMSKEEIKAIEKYTAAADEIYSELSKDLEHLQKYKGLAVFEALSDKFVELYGLSAEERVKEADYVEKVLGREESVSRYRELWAYYAYYSLVYSDDAKRARQRLEKVGVFPPAPLEEETKKAKRKAKKEIKKQPERQETNKKKTEKKTHTTKQKKKKTTMPIEEKRYMETTELHTKRKVPVQFRLRPLLGTILRNDQLSILSLIMERTPMVQPEVLYKATMQSLAKGTNLELVPKLWETYLNAISRSIADMRIKGSLEMLYELNEVPCKEPKTPAAEVYRKTLEVDTIDNPIMYALLDRKYGYVLSCLCRLHDKSGVMPLIRKYELPVNWVSVEECPADNDKTCIKGAKELLKGEIQRTYEFYLRNK